jgi:uncharacterized membrane protein
MLRKTIAKKIERSNKEFRLRGHEVKRIEAFSDAVFAFAVTLLIVSLEVPKSFEELMVTMKGFFAFGLSFLFLMLIWFEQNVFFRRYALDDITTIFLNGCLLFIVLFYVYPLKFLASLIFNDAIYGTHSPVQIEWQQVPTLMIIYSTGYIITYLLFFFMYAHAGRKKEELQLTVIEVFDTKSKMWSQLILVAVGILSVITASFLPPAKSGMAGYVYFLIGPAFTVYYSARGKKRRKLPEESIDPNQ